MITDKTQLYYYSLKPNYLLIQNIFFSIFTKKKATNNKINKTLTFK